MVAIDPIPAYGCTVNAWRADAEMDGIALVLAATIDTSVI
ncbi:MAG: hypothetical protein N838_19910 [Thiohalocapsa sp. PB-PSB1]|nr:MAG: hypothetical protein N838_19910 [Thiohalocapsa sp. PB-PSB1]